MYALFLLKDVNQLWFTFATSKKTAMSGDLTLIVNHNFTFKVCHSAWIIPSFGEWFIIVKILLSGFKLNDPIKLENNFSCVFSGYIRVP